MSDYIEILYTNSIDNLNEFELVTAVLHSCNIYGWFRQLLTSVCTWPSSIWLPLRECLLSPKKTLRECFQIFFKASLTILYTHRIIEFSKTLISNHFLLGLWIKKNVKTVFRKKYYFSDRNARKYSKSKIDFKNVFLRVFRNFDSQFYIFFWKTETFFT